MKTLIEIYQEAVAKGAAKTLIEPLKKFIDAGENEEAWGELLPRWQWLQEENIVTLREILANINTDIDPFFHAGRTFSKEFVGRSFYEKTDILELFDFHM